MKIKRWFSKYWFWVVCATLITASACGGQAADSYSETADSGAFASEAPMLEQEEMMAEEAYEGDALMSDEAALSDGEASAGGNDVAANRATNDSSLPQQQRLIIKNGNMTVMVDETEAAVSQATDIASAAGGYIISQIVFDDPEGYRYATMRLGVPVDRFETVLKALRDLGTVSNESASGEDVTDQYFDLNSRLNNLTATRDRLRDFLNDAKNVEEALRVNDELRVIEEDIAVIQGRINYLADRAAFSTIDLTINPFVPTPTPLPTATATPLPTAQGWRPGDTARVAAVELQDTAQGVADFAIYASIAVLPWLLFWLVIGYILYRIGRRIFRRESIARQTLETFSRRNEEE